MALTNEAVHHITLADGRRFYCRVLKKSRNNPTWHGATGFAGEAPLYQAITRNLPWEVTPSNEVPNEFKPAGGVVHNPF